MTGQTRLWLGLIRMSEKLWVPQFKSKLTITHKKLHPRGVICLASHWIPVILYDLKLSFMLKLNGFKTFVAFNKTWCVWLKHFVSQSSKQDDFSPLQEHRGLLSVRYPMEHGIVNDWNDMERIWQYVYSKEQLQTFSEEVSSFSDAAFHSWGFGVILFFGFLCSILCCWPRLLSIPARTERRLQRFSLRPSMFLLSSSPCRLCWACKDLELK